MRICSRVCMARFILPCRRSDRVDSVGAPMGLVLICFFVIVLVQWALPVNLLFK